MDNERMEETLQPLVERALTGQPGFLEFYLRDQSRLPGSRANVELAQDLSQYLAFLAPAFPDEVRALLNHLTREEGRAAANSPAEFVVTCGLLSFGACAAAVTGWREDVFERLTQDVRNHTTRSREAAVEGLQKMMMAAPDEMLLLVMDLLDHGDCLQIWACLAVISESSLLTSEQFVSSAMIAQRVAINFLHTFPLEERKRQDVRLLRKTLGYTLSVATAASPDDGFALMCEMARWNDPDINWVLRENLKKRRLAKFREYTGKVIDLMA